MAKAYLGIGTNLGNKEKNIEQALKQISRRIGRIVALSASYTTSPWGFESDNMFLNAVACVETELNPFSLLECVNDIESRMGRDKKTNYGQYQDRIIDIDILLYDHLVLHTLTPNGMSLDIPHPQMTKRDFVMRPLAEIAPFITHPISGKSMKEIYQSLTPDAHHINR